MLYKCGKEHTYEAIFHLNLLIKAVFHLFPWLYKCGKEHIYESIFHCNLLIKAIFHLFPWLQLVNKEMFWVVTEICSENNLVKRMKTMKHFIKIASK